MYSLMIITLVGISIWLLSKQASIIVWAISYALISLLFIKSSASAILTNSILFSLIVIFVLFSIKPLRRQLVSKRIMAKMSKIMPSMSSTEREALEAGTVSWEGDLFSGFPDFDKLVNAPVVALTTEEQAFVHGPLNELCRMINDWDITHNRTDMPPEMWKFIKEKGFLGMIIPKKYEGLGFSATAQVFVLAKLYSSSITVATSISVPNSLGPAELLLKYGTKQQKEYYLPRLANGREIPCFALTGPNAGSDAASIPDIGTVCKKKIDDQEVLGITLNWNKRYITLCPVATVIGLAFRLFDPQNLLGKGNDVGISCALIPANTPGVVKGRRHFPLNTGFLNGPTQGKDVFIPIDYLIGGAAMAGLGWRMLMECLSAGRAISLPSSAMGGSQAGALATGAYARVRKQFNTSIANFEGIQEPIARIVGNTYMIDAALTMTAAAIDHGAKPSVAGAILKYHTTERARQVATDAMDIHGGKGICLGPKNYLGRGYQNAPISITVEGANILTRSLIIFGQGVIRCHPFVFREMETVRKNDLSGFDQVFWGHAGFILANLTKSILFNFTDARWTKAPKSKVRTYYQLIHRYSTNLAFISDFAMAILGGKLKRKELVSARIGDLLSYLYLASGVLKRFHDDYEPEADLVIVKWCCRTIFHECDRSIQAIITNFPARWARVLLRMIVNPLGTIRKQPTDRLGQKLAKLLTLPNESRDRLTRFVFKEDLDNCPIGRLESVFRQLCHVEELEKLISKSVKEGKLHTLTLMEQIGEAKEIGILNEEQSSLMQKIEAARQEVIAVDDFSNDELSRMKFYSSEVTSTKKVLDTHST